MTKLKALKVVRIDQPHKSLTSTPKVLAVFSEQAAAEGADALTERIALLQLADQYYLCGFRLLKHGSTWGIQDLVSHFAFDDGQVSRGVTKITPEGFEAHTR